MKEIESTGLKIPVKETDKMSDAVTESYCSLLDKIEWPSSDSENESMFHALLLSQIALLTQQHRFYHVDSCFKKSSMGQGFCRYCFPRKCEPETRIDPNGVLTLRRAPHNEYINAFNDVLLLVLRSNHDIRFLLGSGTTDALYYILKYITKCQNEVDSVEGILMASFDRRQQTEKGNEEGGSPMSQKDAGRARVNSMVLSLFKRQEISAPMSALYLRRGSAMFASHGFAPLLLGQALSVLKKAPHESVLYLKKDGDFVPSTQFSQYLYRHRQLKNMCLMKFVSEMKVKKGTKSDFKSELEAERNSTPAEDRSFFRLSSGHPLWDSHVICRLPAPVVPDIIGPRLPDRTTLTSAEEKEEYALIALALIYPFFHGESRLSASFWGHSSGFSFR